MGYFTLDLTELSPFPVQAEFCFLDDPCTQNSVIHSKSIILLRLTLCNLGRFFKTIIVINAVITKMSKLNTEPNTAVTSNQYTSYFKENIYKKLGLIFYNLSFPWAENHHSDNCSPR